MPDMDQFWKDDEIAHRDNCFFEGPQVALGIRMSDECVFAELGEPGTPWAPIPRQRRLELNRRYNDKAESIVGRRLLAETLPPEGAEFTGVRRIGEVFGGTYRYQHGSEWLSGTLDTPQALAVKLDEVERMDLAAFMLPEDWQMQKKQVLERYGIKPQVLRYVRGPVTLACSLMGSENLIYLLIDEPELARRFSDVIADAIIGMARVMDAEAGTDAEQTRGFSFYDDNCCLLTPDMYEAFGLPVLQKVFSAFSPDAGDTRYQHSDSAMGHLLPLLGRLNLTGVNFGPTVMVADIRAHLPRARVDGCLSPLVFMRNERDEIVRQIRRDCEAGLRFGGVNLSTAGSINDGSSLESMRLVMDTIQQYGRR